MGRRAAVAVLVCTYNQERWVEEALESLRVQTFDGPIDVVIVDDASTDATVSIIRSWLHRTGFEATLLVNRSNRGVCATRNRALAQTDAPFICSLSGDDAYAPNRITVQYEALSKLPASVAVAFSNMEEMDENSEPLGRTFLERYRRYPPPDGDLFETLIPNNWLPAPACMIRRSALEIVGPYDESLCFEDWDMWLRLADRFEFAYVPGDLVRYRVSDKGMSFSPAWRSDMRVSSARILTKWIGKRVELDPVIHDQLWLLGRQLLYAGSPEALRVLTIAAAGQRRRAWVRLPLSASAKLPGRGPGVVIRRALLCIPPSIRRRLE